MKIGNLEIRWLRESYPWEGAVDTAGKLPEAVTRDYSGALAVPDTTPWWLAVHQILDKAELETIQGARNKIGDANRCIAAVGAGEGVDLVRIKLKQAREFALTRQK